MICEAKMKSSALPRDAAIGGGTALHIVDSSWVWDKVVKPRIQVKGLPYKYMLIEVKGRDEIIGLECTD